jgi:hypothetical protein
MPMQANRIHERTSVVLATTTVAVALLGVTSAAAASSAATSAALQGRVVFDCDGNRRFGPPGSLYGRCIISGAITDQGVFSDSAGPCDNPHVRTVSAGKGTIRIEVYRKRGTWLILGGTRAYRGLRGRGWESGARRCNWGGPRSTIIKMVGTVSQ